VSSPQLTIPSVTALAGHGAFRADAPPLVGVRRVVDAWCADRDEDVQADAETASAASVAMTWVLTWSSSSVRVGTP
jgi:hypothetical protein